MTRPTQALPFKLCTALALLSSLGLAHAESDPYALTVSQSLSRDSNVLRVRDSAASADTISTTGLGLSVDQPIGRQRLRASLGAQALRYSNNSQLNYVSPNASLNWDWATADRWQGEVGATHAQKLNSDNTNSVLAAQGKNIERTSTAFARARVGVVTLWTLDGGVTGYDRRFSSAAFANQEQRRLATDLGVRYQPQPDLSVRGLVRHTSGSYPRFSTALGADNFNRNDIETVVALRLSGATAVDLRLTRSQESHSQLLLRSSHTWSGAMGVQWQPTGKLDFRAGLVRDNDTGSQDLTNGTGSTDARLSTRLDLSAQWRATDKIQLTTRFQQTQRDLQAAAATLGLDVQGQDELQQVSLEAAYQAMRALALGCNFSYEKRTVTGNQALSYPYSDHVVGCFGRFTWD